MYAHRRVESLMPKTGQDLAVDILKLVVTITTDSGSTVSVDGFVFEAPTAYATTYSRPANAQSLVVQITCPDPTTIQATLNLQIKGNDTTTDITSLLDVPIVAVGGLFAVQSSGQWMVTVRPCWR